MSRLPNPPPVTLSLLPAVSREFGELGELNAAAGGDGAFEIFLDSLETDGAAVIPAFSRAFICRRKRTSMDERRVKYVVDSDSKSDLCFSMSTGGASESVGGGLVKDLIASPADLSSLTTS